MENNVRETIQLEIEGHPEDNLPEGFIFIGEKEQYFDPEKSSVTYSVIIKRISDNKTFKGEYTNWGHQEYEWELEWTEVFPKQITITTYE